MVAQGGRGGYICLQRQLTKNPKRLLAGRWWEQLGIGMAALRSLKRRAGIAEEMVHVKQERLDDAEQE